MLLQEDALSAPPRGAPLSSRGIDENSEVYDAGRSEGLYCSSNSGWVYCSPVYFYCSSGRAAYCYSELVYFSSEEQLIDFFCGCEGIICSLGCCG